MCDDRKTFGYYILNFFGKIKSKLFGEKDSSLTTDEFIRIEREKADRLAEEKFDDEILWNEVAWDYNKLKELEAKEKAVRLEKEARENLYFWNKLKFDMHPYATPEELEQIKIQPNLSLSGYNNCWSHEIIPRTGCITRNYDWFIYPPEMEKTENDLRKERDDLKAQLKENTIQPGVYVMPNVSIVDLTKGDPDLGQGLPEKDNE